MKAAGRVFRYGDNIDTDVIIPARYLNTSEPKELAMHCMEDIDASFKADVKPGDIIVADKNFGCGSSREHAPIAIKASGISCVIAKTFARIFYRNAINIGLPILECQEAVEGIKTGNQVEIDFSKGLIKNITSGECYKAQPFPEFMQKLIKANGLVNYVKEKKYNLVTLPGDGIGPEIMAQAIKVLDEIGRKFGHVFEYKEHLIGGKGIDEVGSSLPQETIDACFKSDAVLLGAVGGPKWDTTSSGDRPEKGLLKMRETLGLFANLRPVTLYKQLKDASPLKAEVIGDSLDILIVRELTSGIYFGKHKRTICDNPKETYAEDIEYYNVEEIERILKVGFEIAMGRKKKVVVVDKANVLATSKLWREVTKSVAQNYEEVEYSFMYVDNAAMQLIVNPKQFDVIITSNMFGDILSDEASMLTGSIGMLASASLGKGTLGLYEPSHGSAPDIAGQDKANPIATILSAAMMLQYSLGLEEEALAIYKAIEKVLDAGYRTGDIMSKGCIQVGTKEMGTLIKEAI